jgi:hypothetical protein
MEEEGFWTNNGGVEKAPWKKPICWKIFFFLGIMLWLLDNNI